MTRLTNPISGGCDADDLRLMMRRIASSVAVITSRGPDGPAGITATSITSVSMEPPSLLICVNQATRLHDAVLRTGLFRVNYLSRGQSGVARAFGGRFDGDRFSCGEWDCAAEAGPKLEACLGDITCQLSGVTPFGTHSVFIGLIAAVGVGGKLPLIYCNGDYASLSSQDAA